MIFKKIYIFISLVLLPFLLPLEVMAEEVLWPYFHYPPLYFVEEGKIYGYGAHVQKIIHNQMPEYDHKQILAQPARLFDDLKNGTQYIAYGPVKTPERLEYLYYSLPCRLVFSDGIVMHKEKVKKYLIDSKISLKKILEDEHLIMGHSKGASYGNYIDNILKEYSEKTKQEIITGEESETRQIKMIRAGRIDWMIWDPLALKILLKKEGMQKDYGIYEIHEKEDTFIYAHIAVPKNEWGKKMIHRINLILKKSIPTDEFYNGLAVWVPDELKASFRKGYEDLLIKPALAYEPKD